ncbi:MAG: argininosuccinate lyase [Microscillaceae bacterium]|jgi:argininosuccinate lyase|nr:argininosuccinate lyase [Microscillaceae bacterium]
MKLWDKGIATDQFIEHFTIGKDTEFDLRLAEWDVIGTLAHIEMLAAIDLLPETELKILQAELKRIYQTIKAQAFRIENGVEDIHSQVEWLLTQKLGEIGKKVHSGRSRNDQVLVDIKLFLRQQIQEIVEETQRLFALLIDLSRQFKDVLLPGYTHLQIAMPSSFGLWLGAYSESLSDDLLLMQSVFRLINQNPLGSGAGYGSSFPLNRQMTTDLLGFANLNYNVVYAQMTRGKAEKNTAWGLANIAATLSRLAMDATLYMSQNFGFISFPDHLTTGSSIMPHKKNPDVFELIRAKCNQIQALPNEITLIINNLPSGYHRDLQILKASLFPAIDTLKECLQAMQLMMSQMQVKSDILTDEKYQYLFSVEVVNQLVIKGLPFREAYQKVGQQIAEGSFAPSQQINHSHEGSIGNLCLSEIEAKMNKIIESFEFEKVNQAWQKLISA